MRQCFATFSIMGFAIFSSPSASQNSIDISEQAVRANTAEAQISLDNLDVGSKWTLYRNEVSGKEVVDILDAEGWSKNDTASEISLYDNYVLYKKNIGAGVHQYLVTKEDDMEIVQFPPSLNLKFKETQAFNQGMLLANTSFNFFDPESIKDKLLQIINSTLENICGMKVPPHEIIVKASAAGVIEFELTWASDEVCNK